MTIDLESQWRTLLLIVALASTRMLVAFSVIPLFVGNTVPAYIRVAFVAGLTFALMPLALADDALSGISAGTMGIYVAKEATIGLVLGLLASVAFWALYVAGSIIESQAGLSFATTIDPLSGQEDSLLGTLLMRLFTTLFLLTGGLLSLIGMLFESYRAWPLSSLQPITGTIELARVVIDALGDLLLSAIKVAAPFVILMLLAELAIGLLSRFAPQLNVFFVSLPLKVLIMTAMLLLYGMVVAASGGMLPPGDFDHVLQALQGGGR